jgi:threonine/homoserine/homoserine lactone efflux protein
MAFWGLSEMMARFPILLPLSRLVGCAVLSAVGIYFLVRPRHFAPTPARSGVDGWRSALLGFTMTAANPTLIVSWSAAVGAAHATGLLRIEPHDALPFAGGVGMGTVTWFATLLRLLERFRARAEARMVDRIVRAMGGALVLLGVGMGVRVALRWA